MSKNLSKSFRFEWEPLGERQIELRDAIQSRTVSFAIGPAGTGKSLVATYCALDSLDKGIKAGGVSSIVVTRPLVVVGQSFGFLPGDVKEKTDPYLEPIYDLIKGANHPRTQDLLDSNCPQLRGMPVEMMRGCTFSDTFVVVDEAQNLTRQQFEMLLTRVGQNCKMVFTGDSSQIDLKPSQSGLSHAISLLESEDEVAVVKFTVDDVKRSDFVGRVIRAYASDREK